ncbi:MAG: metalloregulator ArsR/SmtB family transcription factor [Gemmatimonadota bacterium]|nr:metalloregulator ArsR/SmtB family transcription factor [Gemmatimonadota bacterium]
MTPSPTIFERMSALADTTRSRLLLLLEEHELTVSELCAVVQLPQSTVSRHLKLLGDEGWVVAHAEGTSRRYRMLPDRLEPAAQNLWTLVRAQMTASPVAQQDGERVRGVLSRRRTRSQEFFSTAAGEWDRVRAELYGDGAGLPALLGLLDEKWVVGDLGCGTGQIAGALAPSVARVIAVDESAAMLSAARTRLQGVPNVQLRQGEVEKLPLKDGELDGAVLFLVLHYLAEPPRALREAARALRPGGRLLVVDMMPHQREEYRQRMGHLWQGFSQAEVVAWAAEAGLEAMRYHPLPPDPGARGPVLFAASARKQS